MSSMPKHQFVRSLVNVLFVAISLSAVLICQRAQAQTFSVEQIERRIVIGFQVNAETLQARLPSPWQLSPLADGPLKGTNLLLTLVDNLRTENAQGKASVGLQAGVTYEPLEREVLRVSRMTLSTWLNGFGLATPNPCA